MKKKNTVSAKFYCESCGAQVPRNAKFCEHCGRFFASVKCPVCGKIGSPDSFASGCPKCGYAMKNSSRKKGNRISRSSQNRFRNAIDRKNGFSTGDDSLPVWMYITVPCALVVFLCGILWYFAQ